jgi:hypothetical protein
MDSYFEHVSFLKGSYFVLDSDYYVTVAVSVGFAVDVVLVE